MATQKTDPIIDYVARAKQAEESSKQAQINVANILSEQEAANNEQALQVAAAGDAKKSIIFAQDALTAATDAQKAAIVEAYSTDFTKQGSDVLRWTNEAKINRDAAYESEKKLREAQKVDFMSNPLGFISAQFEIPTLAAQYNYHAGLTNSAEANIDAIVNNTNSASIMATNTAKLVSTDLTIAKGEEAVALMAQHVAKIKADSAGQRIQGISVLQQMSGQDLDRMFKVRAALNDDRRLQLAEESNAMQREARAYARQDAADKLEAKNAQLDVVKTEMEAYNAGARRAGKLTFSDPKMFLAYHRANQNLPEYSNVLTSGKLIMLNGGKSDGIMVADSAGEAAVIYSTGQAKTPVAQFLKQTLQTLKADPTAPKDRQAMIGKISEAAGESAKLQLKNIDQNSPNANIYSAPPATVVLQNRAVSQLPFIEQVVRPLSEKSRDGTIKDEVIISSAISYATVPDGKVNFNEAAESVARYYKTAVAYNNTSNQYMENGLPEQVKYMARVNNKMVDLTDPIAIRRHMLQTQSTGISLFKAHNMVPQ